MKRHYLVYNNIDLSYTNSFTDGGQLFYKITYVWPGARNLHESSGQLTIEKYKEQGSQLLLVLHLCPPRPIESQQRSLWRPPCAG